MKYLLLSLFLACGLVGKIFAQTDHEVIKTVTEKYIQAFKNGDTKTVLNSIYPKLFETIPREMMELKMNEMATDSAAKVMKPIFESMYVGKVSKILVLNGIKYAVVQYGAKMNYPMDFSSETVDFMKKMLEADGRHKNVQYDATTQKITADLKAEMFAIYNPEYGAWKFLEKKESTKTILSTFLSEKEVAKLYKLK